MSWSRSSGVSRTLGEVKPVRLPFVPRTVPNPSPGSCRKPYHSRPAAAACQRVWGTRWAWMSMDLMADLPGRRKDLTDLHRKYTVSTCRPPYLDRGRAEEASHERDDRGQASAAGRDDGEL